MTQHKPLIRLQAFLKELRTCIKLLGDIFIEIKKVLVILTIILFFVLGVYDAVSRLFAQSPRSSEQTASRPYEQLRK